MPNISLWINTSNNSLLAGQASTVPIDPATLPLFFGDTLNLQITLLQTPPGYNPTGGAGSSLQVVSTAGLQLFVYIDDGTVAGTIYTSQVAWSTDANNSYFFGTLALNTAALSTLVTAAGTAGAACWLKIGFVQGGQQTTVLSKQITVGVGLPTAAVGPVPPGQTPLSAEVARQTFFPLQPVAGLGIFLESAAGKIQVLRLIDDADGTATPVWQPVN